METRSWRTLALTLAALLALSTVAAPQTANKTAPKPQQQTAAPAAQPRQMTPAEIEAGLKAGRKILLVDVRTPAQFSAGHPPDAINVPLAQLQPRMKQLQVPKPVEVVAVCGSAGVAATAVGQLVKMGYSKAAYTLFQDWVKSGRKLERTPPPPRAAKK